MQMKRFVPYTLFLMFVLCGCWTFNRSEYPPVVLAKANGGAAKLMLTVTGFDANITEYEVAHSYSTVYVPGYCGYHRYHPGFTETSSTTMLIPMVRATDMFRTRAQEQFENAGFSIALAPTLPDYVVDARFSGPVVRSGDTCKALAWMVCTLFFCDYTAEEWTAHLRIRDNRTGKVAFTHDYVQRFEANVFGLIPIFSIASCDETSPSNVQSWCLAALTDRMVADAAAFFADKGPVKAGTAP